MLNFPAVTSLIALLCTGLCTVDAGAIAARAPRAAYAIGRSMFVERDVVSPPITQPTTGTQWDAGSRQTVTWDTSVIPPGFNSNGMIVLGYLDEADGPNEHLDLAHPLAANFPITIGHIGITVPSVPTRDTYILVLFGDSGNASGKFTIKGLSIGSPSSSSTVAPSASSSSIAAPSTSPGASSTIDSPVTSSPDSATSSSVVFAGETSSSSTTGATFTSTVPASSISAARSLATQGPAVAASTSAPTAGSSSRNAAYHSATPGGSWMYGCVVYVFGIALGFAL